MSSRRSRHAGRAFTLIEIMVVISIILVLASLVLGVGSALLRRAERSQVESAMTIMESAFTEWEGQTGRPVTYNGAFNSLTAPTTEIFPSGATLEVFDVREPGTPPAPNNSGNRLIYTRARGAGARLALGGNESPSARWRVPRRQIPTFCRWIGQSGHARGARRAVSPRAGMCDGGGVFSQRAALLRRTLWSR